MKGIFSSIVNLLSLCESHFSGILLFDSQIKCQLGPSLTTLRGLDYLPGGSHSRKGLHNCVVSSNLLGLYLAQIIDKRNILVRNIKNVVS